MISKGDPLGAMGPQKIPKYPVLLDCVAMNYATPLTKLFAEIIENNL